MKRIALLAVLICLRAVLWSQTGSIKIKITGVEMGAGNLKIAIFNKPDGFPMQYQKALHLREIPSPEAEVEVVFDNLAAGRYAVAVLQDTNNNGKLDTALFGIPKEPWGVSNNAKGKLGPPSFESALFSVKDSVGIEIAIASGTH